MTALELTDTFQNKFQLFHSGQEKVSSLHGSDCNVKLVENAGQ